MSEKGDGNCRSRVEEIYWTHFKALRFAQFLRTGYDQHLVLPKTFSDNVKKLPEKVNLRGPSGVVWNVGVRTKDETILFTNGWQQFFKDHSLKENDFLVFKYNGESMFDVLIFDGCSLCEKATSYFVGKCGGYIEIGGEHLTRGEFSDSGVQCASPEKSVYDNGVIVLGVAPLKDDTEMAFDAGVESASPERYMEANGVTKLELVTYQTNSKGTRKTYYDVKPVQTKRRGTTTNGSSDNQGVVDWVTDHEPSSVIKSRKRELYFTSNRRPAIENEIQNALELAQAACTSSSFYIVMRPTHVYKRFYVSISNKWIFEHISPRSQNMILRIGPTEWHAKYSLHNIRNTGGLTGGWKYFAVDNNLEEDDVCVFEPAGQINNTLILDVRIFRVVEEITPLSMVGNPEKRGRKINDGHSDIEIVSML